MVGLLCMHNVMCLSVCHLSGVCSTVCTGEPDHGEATDEEESPTVKLKPAPEKHHAPQSVSVEVLVRVFIVLSPRYVDSPSPPLLPLFPPLPSFLSPLFPPLPSSLSPLPSSPPLSPPLLPLSPQQQMAQWNKMVAYLNLALLFFLILLVITVVICMNYYWIVYQMSPSQAAPTYLSGPMA